MCFIGYNVAYLTQNQTKMWIIRHIKQRINED